MRFNRRLSATAQPDLVPMIDVVFQLVVFFLMSSTFVVSPGISLSLPESRTTQSVVTDAMNIYVYADGAIFVGETSHSMESLEAFLASGEVPTSVPVSLLAEADSPYQGVISVLDALRINGYTSIALRAEVDEEE